MVDVSISFDPVGWVIEVLLIIYLVKWARWEKKEARKRPRKPKQVLVTNPTVVQLRDEEEPKPIKERKTDEEPNQVDT